MLSATPAAMTTKKLIPGPSPQSANHSQYGGKKYNKKGGKTPGRSSSIVTGPKHMNPDYTGDKSALRLSGKRMSNEMSQMDDTGMKRLMATERIIDEALKMLDTDPYSDLGNWPADAICKGDARLSESKMKNEIDHREPRTKSFEGRFTEYPLFSTDLGSHSDDRRDRRSEIEDLGEGTVLYFKFLKYWMFIFFISTVLSGPALAVFLYGMQYDQITEPFYAYVARSFMGNMGSFTDMSCTNANLPDTKN